jgi:hypothetical protein
MNKNINNNKIRQKYFIILIHGFWLNCLKIATPDACLVGHLSSRRCNTTDRRLNVNNRFWWNNNCRWKAEVLLAFLFITSPSWTTPGSNHDIRGENRVTSHTSCFGSLVQYQADILRTQKEGGGSAAPTSPSCYHSSLSALLRHVTL